MLCVEFATAAAEIPFSPNTPSVGSTNMVLITKNNGRGSERLKKLITCGAKLKNRQGKKEGKKEELLGVNLQSKFRALCTSTSRI